MDNSAAMVPCSTTAPRAMFTTTARSFSSDSHVFRQADQRIRLLRLQDDVMAKPPDSFQLSIRRLPSTCDEKLHDNRFAELKA